eukprot:2021708-Amphidinium_carterae.1
MGYTSQEFWTLVEELEAPQLCALGVEEHGLKEGSEQQSNKKCHIFEIGVAEFDQELLYVRTSMSLLYCMSSSDVT